MAQLYQDCIQEGFDKLTAILDNNSIHKNKIVVDFIHTPTYSPNFNLVEYIMHILRLRLLHHLPLVVDIQQVQEKLENYFKFNQLQTPHQIQNIIQHIGLLFDF